MARIAKMAPLLLALLLFAALPARNQDAPPPSPSLRRVLSNLDRASVRIHSLSAHAVNTNYVAVVDQTETSTGSLYFRRTRSGPQIKLEFLHPHKILLYRNGYGYIYQPDIRQVQKYNARKNQSSVQTFLLLGLGASGAQLSGQFKIRLPDQPQLDDRHTVLLQLFPLDPGARRSISEIDLWFDPATWVAVRQKYIQPSGDYRLLTLSHIRVNPHLPSSLFKASFPGAKQVTPKF